MKRVPLDKQAEDLWEVMVRTLMRVLDIDRAAAEDWLRKKARQGLRLDEE